MKNAARFLLSGLVLLLVITRAGAPVEFRRVVDQGANSPSSRSLHHLLSHAIGAEGTSDEDRTLARFVEEWKKEQGSPTGVISPGVG